MAYGFYFDSARCTGCRTCEMACKDYHDLSTEAAFRRVFDYEGGEFVENADGTVTATTYAYHLSEACNHCESPKCFAACPTGAIEKDEDGIVYIKEDVCTGTGACVDACPFGVPILVKEKNKAVKCALEWGDLDELKKAHPDAVHAIAPMADPSITNPSVIINACPAAKEVGDTTGAVANEKEVTFA